MRLLSSNKRKQSEESGSFYRHSKLSLMLGAYASASARHDFGVGRNEFLEHPEFFIVDFPDAMDAEIALLILYLGFLLLSYHMR